MDFYTKGILASNMVLLQNSINCIYGCAPAKRRITMTFRGQAFETVSDKSGNWKFELNAGLPTTNEIMVIYCEGAENNIVFENVAVGEVWLCSGQSNMQLTMERLKFTYPDEFKKPENQNIRMITVPVTYAFDGPKDTVQNPTWKLAGPDTMASLSGTAYFFAKKMQEELGVPVGIINASQGGTPITAWMDEENLDGMGNYIKRLKDLQSPGFIEDIQNAEKTAMEKWNDRINLLDPGVEESWENLAVTEALGQGWEKIDIPGEVDLVKKGGIVWFKKEIVLSQDEVKYLEENGGRLWLGVIRDADKAFINGVQVGVTYYVYPPRRYDIPRGVLKEGVNVITLRVQQNLHNRKMFFWPEKHYAIASNDLQIMSGAIRNVERTDGLKASAPEHEPEVPENGIYIPLDGEWICCGTSQTEDIPPTTFFEYEPTALYNAMLAPCFHFAVRGALWYQGESNTEKYYEYKELLCRMISLWRKNFTYCPEEKMPFVVMQLPSWADDLAPDSYPVFSDWALLREAQAEVIEMTENTALSVAVDAGEWNDLHPEKKLTGGTRCAEQALALVYDKDYPKAAVIKSASGTRKNYTVTFETENELEAFEVLGDTVFFDKPTNKVKGFGALTRSILGKEEVIMCHGEIQPDRKTVNISLSMLPMGTKVVEIRYLWANCPECVNLYAGGLPVTPGRVIL